MPNLHSVLNLIDGKLQPSANDSWVDVDEPATGNTYARAPNSNADDIQAAYAAAQNALTTWSSTSADERARHLNNLADLVAENAIELAEAESRDTGKPISLARQVDIPRAITNLRFFASAATQFSSESHAMESRGFNYTLRQPVGVVACISPWNLPLYLLTWKIAPAIAAGNTVVAKPSEVTPYSAWLLSQLSIRAKLPPGVLNIVHGTGGQAGNALVSHPSIKAISFTGSTKTGAIIAAQAAPQFKKLSLELGGKNAFIVFGDANFDRALDHAVRAAFSNQGQICLCGSRFLIQRSIYPRFRDALIARTRALKVGDPMLEDTQFGSLSSYQHQQKVLSYIELARNEGGKILCGGKAATLTGRCQNGWFVEPTLIEGLSAQCRTNTEEIFGPVASLTPFDDEAEVLRLTNATNYGLACSIWTQDISTAHRLASHIESGIVWINTWMLRDLRTPFGGVKQSGIGREGGLEAMRFFTEPKNICVAY
jgi:aminomuconate-semialdehyde/2-hydroxymuconate-6-semialdehyde dehydrogenase